MSSVNDKQTEIESAIQRAEALRQEKRYDEGIALLSDALRYGMEQAQLYYRLGNLYYDAKRYEHAEYAYRRAIDYDALHVNAHYNLGVVYRKQGRIDESLKMRRKANELARRHPERVKVSPEQVTHVRRLARRMFLGGLLLIAVILLLVLLIRP
jgi:tetratricopeptide (TPR) repeat protein